ncbi:glucose-6-phosphate dehydrogenase assembly protein OpcA [Actinomyces capricornis]|uniref:Glucose-6-phosphate dehydrogenase assembly protein OpcA n=1 Tax=Actinomyces capricornis TaxID=2755559 RepID=A0ABM7UES0_9ACTO|nr:glucose-6-phosphate dehydrogenase assembly protein OpcA [Actinomyces capricornis]BDA65681.1 glucose-6-phosphate dehydrogenase assembly protein OpcA [Actinomyces capricornis]
MITRLSATTTARIVSELLEHSGSAGASRVLTLVIPTDDQGLDEALCAAHGASRDHPCRVIAVVAPAAQGEGGAGQGHAAHGPAGSAGHLDAEIRVGHDAGAGETIVLRPWGEAAEHTDTLVVPFLLPDVPVVVWWPEQAPMVPSEDPLGRLGSTRITNTPAQEHPDRALAALAPVSVRGDIDLAWTRITLWRAMVVTTLDSALRGGRVERITITGQPENSSVSLMAAWLGLRLGVEVTRLDEQGFLGIATITAHTSQGDIIIARHDHERVTITRPGTGEPQVVTMARREPITTLNEELRRLTPDLVYHEVLTAFSQEYAHEQH